MIKKNFLFPMKLQFFAEEGNIDAETQDGDGEQTPEDDEINKNEKQTFTTNEVNQKIQDALKEAEKKWKIETDTRLKNVETEATKLAKMTAEQKAEYEKQKNEKALVDRETAITKRELTATAKEALVEKGLPLSLADVLNYSDADACQKSIEAVEKAFNEAVQKAVEERIKGGAPLKKAPQDSEDNLETQIYQYMKG